MYASFALINTNTKQHSLGVGLLEKVKRTEIIKSVVFAFVRS